MAFRRRRALSQVGVGGPGVGRPRNTDYGPGFSGGSSKWLYLRLRGSIWGEKEGEEGLLFGDAHGGGGVAVERQIEELHRFSR